MLCGYLYKYSSKWREIGIALHFEHGELEIINTKFQAANNPYQQLNQLLSQWSQWPVEDHQEVYPTMEKLRDALRSGIVGLGAEAKEIYKLKDDLPSKLRYYS